jgi:asparagine synthase (glutamine-hydrolysing)
MTFFYGGIASNRTNDSIRLDSDQLGPNSLSNGNLQLINESTQSCIIDSLIISYIGNPSWVAPNRDDTHQNTNLCNSIAKAYKDIGKHFLNKLTGEFVVVIHDTENKKTLIGIDKMGIGRLVYKNNNGLIFSNSIKTIQHFSNSSLNIQNQAIYNYIYFHMLPSPGSFFSDILKLEPAHYLEYSNGQLRKERYWVPEFKEKTLSSDEQLRNELHNHLDNAVKRCSPNQQTGAFLSGGLDSSTVSGKLAHFQKNPKTFTIGFDAEGYDETPFARVTSKHFKTKHHEYFVTPEDVLESIPKIASAYDEPFGNSSAIPTYFCAKLAKESGCNLLLAGDGGDELFAGNERYSKQKIFETYNSLPSILRTFINKPFALLPSLQRTSTFSKGYSFLKQTATPLPSRMENYNFLHQISPNTVFHTDLFSDINSDLPLDLLKSYYDTPKNASSLNRMQYMDWKRTLADNDLRKVSHMCELAGINVKYPFLDSELVDFSCTIPSNVKLKGMQLRHFYKQAMKNFLPNEVLTKPKHGFGLPFGVWMSSNKQLQDLAYDNITCLKERHFFDPFFLDNAIEQHRTGHASYYGELIWVLMMLELWLNSHQNQ